MYLGVGHFCFDLEAVDVNFCHQNARLVRLLHTRIASTQVHNIQITSQETEQHDPSAVEFLDSIIRVLQVHVPIMTHRSL
jgi:hypothetical protein